VECMESQICRQLTRFARFFPSRFEA
jgi:hypothetical protein